MQRGIQSMDMIYECSTLNIIAGSGYDATAGLPGVTYCSRTSRQDIEEVKPGVRMGVYRELSVHLSLTRYSTRAWT